MVAKPGLVLVSGPSRGGKSRWAESLLKQQAKVTYLATSANRPDDPSWQSRLRLHRERRPQRWGLIETTSDLPETITRCPKDEALLVDSLGGFVAWCLDLDQEQWEQRSNQLVRAVEQPDRMVVMVIEETGWGVVPATPIGGLFRDRLGLLAQQLETRSDRSWLVLQGRAIDLHAIGEPV